MNRRNIFMGENPVRLNEAQVEGEFVELDGEVFYKISNVDRMPDFFISLVSASDQWMFISSNGSLTAGRKNSESSLFPYYSEDNIHDYGGKTGSRTLILVKQARKLKLWEPFFGDRGIYRVKRHIYKNLPSNKLLFEELNEDLSLSFRYSWCSSDRYGFVKEATLLNLGTANAEVEVLDGLQNILPSSADPGLQLGSSNLLDAYKRQELIEGTTLAIYRLSSVPTDAAEPSEALRVNTVWSEGLGKGPILLSTRQLDAFRTGYPLDLEKDVKATRGAYFVHAHLEVPGGGKLQWRMVAEVNQDVAGLADLVDMLKSGEPAGDLLKEDAQRSSADLVSILAASDGLQKTEDELSSARHLSNVLFNVMRGGIFTENYKVQRTDFLDFISKANSQLAQEAEALVADCGEHFPYGFLLKKARLGKHPGLMRLSYEYLALSFSRRHGDPSRPWNKFSIENRTADGQKKFDFEGNWRDIFQNWEALSFSFPGYVESMISKFVNASTADGYNPYRITRGGIDWEVPDPSDPWSNIGYWGDHQLIYLLKFLEISENHHPGRLHELLSMELFSYAHIPYRIKSYRELLENPHDTIVFDDILEEEIKTRVQTLGSDGRLVRDKEGQVMLVNLAEKLLVPLLVKLSNFIPGAGIWMNTQRPEWNDANNALVGYGVSMVTACYLRAYVDFSLRLFDTYGSESVLLSEEVAEFFRGMKGALDDQMQQADGMLSDRGMKSCLDLFGEAGSLYRQRFYKDGFSGKSTRIGVSELSDFFSTAREALDFTISSNRRQDGLYHAYNLIRVDEDKIVLRRLYEMLEGQVAVLSSGFLQTEEALSLLDALKSSALFREDQYSYILYPDRVLPSFMEKNNIPAVEVKHSALLQKLLEHSNKSIVIKDVKGDVHFQADFRNAGLLEKALEALGEEYAELVDQEKEQILDIYESLFDHQSFTGRSGTFYGYEGLGSIYWHMVSKLLLAVCESYYRAAGSGANVELLGKLAEHFYEIRAGIGLNKAPDVYGAFPTDPYSHTPRNRGAQQPGMTGQVKEDIIARWGELGIQVREGSIQFQPILLRQMEFLSSPGEFIYQNLKGEEGSVQLDKDTLAFTYCQVPVIYHLSARKDMVVHLDDGTAEEISGLNLGPDFSEQVFNRTGTISRIEVWLSPGL